jgi:cell division protein ZapA (FtsZ GTPase activity inhibitor)
MRASYTVADHHALMDFAMKNAVPIIKILNLRVLVRRSAPPEPTEILKAMLKVPGISRRVASLARRVIKEGPELEKHMRHASKEDLLFLASLRTALATQRTIASKIKKLETMRQQKKHTAKAEHRRAIAFALRLLKTGQRSVYSTSHPFYGTFRSKNRRLEEVVADMGESDLEGGIRGLLFGPPGGAVFGAVVSSLATGASAAVASLC